MAALHYAANTANLHRRLTSGTLNFKKHPILLISSSFTSIPAKITRRKNHLRQKILKTLERPVIPKPPPSNPIIPLDASPFQDNMPDSCKLEEVKERDEPKNSVIEEINNFEGLKVGEVSKPEGNLAKKSISSYGVWLVGAFVVCAIWVFSSTCTDTKNQSSNGTEKGSVIEMGGDGEGKPSEKIADELELESKIDEIRVMASKAREAERLESKKSSPYDGKEMDGGPYSKIGIESGVDDWLIKLRKNLRKTRDKIPVASDGYLRQQNEIKDVVEKGELYERGSNGKELLFKKKYRFKGMSNNNPTDKPKGFACSDNARFRSGKKEKGNVFGKPKVKHGIALDKNNGKKLDGEAGKSKKSSASEIDILEGKRVGDATLALDATNFWWSSLPYALVIVMRRGHNGEGGEGFYTLKNIISSTDDRTSHMVAFEDRRDATNFCYLLQSFFEDLGEFEADVVPLTVKELNESAKYYNSRVVVVKRGQLKLYAGQPLADAEVALRAMIKM